MSVSALARAANSEIHGGSIMNPIVLSAAETKQTLQQVALEDRRIMSAVGQRFCLQLSQAPIGLGELAEVRRGASARWDLLVGRTMATSSIPSILFGPTSRSLGTQRYSDGWDLVDALATLLVLSLHTSQTRYTRFWCLSVT